MAYQKLPDSKALDRELNTGKLERIYLFLGEEEGEKEKMIGRIIRIISHDNEYSSAQFHAESGELHAASEYAMSGSMFAETKVCVLFNINSIKTKSGDSGLLTDVIDNFPEPNILIMTSSENKVPSVLSKSADRIKIFQFWRYFENDLKNYIINSLKKKGIDIHAEAAKLLVDLTGRDVKKIDEAMFNLQNSGEKSVTADVIKYMIPDTKEVSVFEFIDSLFQKKRDAFHDLQKVLDAGNNELMILKLISRQAELIEKYYYSVNNNKNSSSALQEIGISQRNTDVFLKCVKNFSLSGIKNVFTLIHKADYRLKSFGFSGSISNNPLFDLVSSIII